MATRGFNRWRWDEWGRPCKDHQSIVKYDWQGQVAVDEAVWSWTNAKIVPALRQLNAVFNAHNYDVDSAGSYNCRTITGGSIYSPHAWALAVDINPWANPYRPMPDSGPITNIPFDLIRDVYRIVTVKSRQRVWKWGGDWDGDWDFDDHTVTDAMHFEVIATPDELAEGVAFDGTLEPPTPEYPMLKQGDEGNAVRWFQEALNGFRAKLVIDGLYGPKTAEAVKEYQRAADLAATGTIDGVTAVLLARYHPEADEYPDHIHKVRVDFDTSVPVSASR